MLFQANQANHPQFLAGDGVSAQLVRTLDWSGSSLGVADEWPPSLKVLLNTILSSPYPMYLAWGPDLIWFFNDAYRPILGNLTAGFGQPLPEARSDHWPVMKPMVEQALSGKKVFAEDLPLFDFFRHDKQETAYFTFSYSPARDEAGVIQGMLCVCIETTVPMQERASMRRDNRRIRELFERAPSFIAMSVGPQHRLELTNESFTELCGRGSLLGHTIRDALPELEGQGVFEVLDHVYATGEPFLGHEVPVKLKAPDGELRKWHINFMCTPVRDEDECVTGIFVEGFDVSEARHSRKEVQRLQNELIHVSRLSAMGTMASTLAHEINQPLTAALSYIQGARRILKKHGHLPVEAEQGLTGAEEATKRAGTIITSLREMSKKGTSEVTTVSVGWLVHEAKKIALIGVRQLGVSYEESISPDLHVACDPLQLQQVLVNLIRNAVEATSAVQDRIVRIQAEAHDDGIQICVSDSGQGVDEQIKRHLFEAFQTTKEDGVGIGLSICRTIVENHHGRLWLEDSATTGSRFCLWLPSAAAE